MGAVSTTSLGQVSRPAGAGAVRTGWGRGTVRGAPIDGGCPGRQDPAGSLMVTPAGSCCTGGPGARCRSGSGRRRGGVAGRTPAGAPVDDPILQMLAGAGGEDLGEAADETVGCREFGAMGEDSGQLLVLTLREPVGVTHDPPGDLPDPWRRGSDDADATSASWPQVVANDLVAAAVAERLELGV